MALFLVFSTQADAQTMEAGITALLGLPTQPGNVTTRWNNVRERADGKWVVLWPGNENIPPDAPVFTVEAYQPEWFPDDLE